MNQPARQQKAPHVYRNFAFDSRRWDKFTPRQGDIFICTPSKCGTTWTQMICALLIFQKPKLERPLSDYSPWLDMQIAPVGEVIERLEAQTHRRFIKTHTPFDGMPYYPDVTYLCVGRDARDAFISMDSQGPNANPEIFRRMMSYMQEGDPRPSRPVKDLRERFRLWITAPGTPEASNDPQMMPAPPFINSYWQYRHLPNIHLFHYNDMKRDLAGEMRGIAGALGIDVPEKIWPSLVEAAQFESMKENSAMLAPDAKTGIWRDPAAFFSKGVTGQWHDVLGPEELSLYENTMRERFDPEMVRWVEMGRAAG